eukprot:8973966-Alexandrium_andersonii.AAC.1
MADGGPRLPEARTARGAPGGRGADVAADGAERVCLKTSETAPVQSKHRRSTGGPGGVTPEAARREPTSPPLDAAGALSGHAGPRKAEGLLGCPRPARGG